MDTLQLRSATAAVSAAARRVTEDGRTFVVAPIVACKTGVLNGSLVHAETLGRLLDEWQSLPVTVDHPPKTIQSSINATHGWIGSHKIGEMRNVHVVDNSLKGELWMPLNGQGEQAAKIIASIEAGKVNEVSVGYLAVGTRTEGVHDGKEFREITRETAPNHVAILASEIGACSVAEGCGTPRVASADSSVSFEGFEETSWQQAERGLSAFVRAAAQELALPDLDPHTPVENLPQQVKAWIAAKTLAGDASATTAEALLRVPVVNPSTGRLNLGAVTAAFGHKVQSLPIETDKKEEVRAVAGKLLEQFNATEEPMAASSSVKFNARRMGVILSKAVQERAANASERKTLIGRMASEAKINEKRVKAIMAGSEDFTEDRIIRAFGNVLEISSGILFTAAFDDVEEMMRTLNNEGEADAPQAAPAVFAKNLVAALASLWPTKNGGKKVMKRCELEGSIKAAAKLGDDDAKQLAAIPLAGLRVMARASGVEVSDADFQAMTADEAPEVKPEVTPEAKLEAKPEAKSADAPLTAADLNKAIADAVPAIVTSVTNSMQAAKDEAARAELVVGAKALGLSDEEIKATPVAVLSKMVGGPQAHANYSGQAGSIVPAEGDETLEATVAHMAEGPSPYVVPKAS